MEEEEEEASSRVREVLRQGREVKGGMGSVLEGGRSRGRGRQQTQGWEGNVGPTESEMGKSLPLSWFPTCLSLS